MLLTLFKLIHVFVGLNAIGIGIAVAIRMASGRRFERWAVQFLKYSLAASATGMLLALDHPDIMSWAAALGVYLSGLAVLTSRKSGLSGDWALAFLLSTLSVLCLDTVVAVAHLFRVLARFNLLKSSPDNTVVVFAAALITVLMFAVLSVVSVRKSHMNATSSFVHKVTR
jgi:hypothetical protein